MLQEFDEPDQGHVLLENREGVQVKHGLTPNPRC